MRTKVGANGMDTTPMIKNAPTERVMTDEATLDAVFRSPELRYEENTGKNVVEIGFEISPTSTVGMASATRYASVEPVAPKNHAISCSRTKPMILEIIPKTITIVVARAILLLDTTPSLSASSQLLNKSQMTLSASPTNP